MSLCVQKEEMRWMSWPLCIRDYVPPVHPTTPAVSLLVRIRVGCTHRAASKANPCKVVRHDEPEWQRPVCNLRHERTNLSMLNKRCDISEIHLIGIRAQGLRDFDSSLMGDSQQQGQGRRCAC
jgi:hypothetical protein